MGFIERFYSCELQVADSDRGVFAETRQKIAKHEAESWEFFYARVLAWALWFHPENAFAADIFTAEHPTIHRASILDQEISAIYVGLPEAKSFLRSLRAAPSVERTVVFYASDHARQFCHHMRGVKQSWMGGAGFFNLEELIQGCCETNAIADPWSVTVIDETVYLRFADREVQWTRKGLDMSAEFQVMLGANIVADGAE